MRTRRGLAVSLLAVILGAVVLTTIVPGQNAITLTVPYSTRAVALADLDGNPTTGDWSEAASVTVPFENALTNQYGAGTLYAKHDGSYLYLRVDGKIDAPWTSATGDHFWLGFMLSPPLITGHHKGGQDDVFFGLWDGTDYAPQPTYPPRPVDTNGGLKPPAKDTTQNVDGALAYSGTAAPYSFTAEWRRPLNSGDSLDIALTADGTSVYPFYVTTDSDGGGSGGGSIDHSSNTHENTMTLQKVPSAAVHDVAITTASASPLSGIVGTTVTIAATAANQGTEPETFDVKAYAGTILVGTNTVTSLAAGATTSLSYTWNTAGVAAGSYVIKVEAAAVTGETDLADNAYTDGTVRLDAIVHDVAITTAAASPLSGLVGTPISITATAANQGNQAETFDVTASAGSIVVGTQTVTSLAAGGTKNLAFTWDTASAPAGSYPIKVEATAVAGETDLSDNAYADGTVVLSAVVHDVAVTSASASPTTATVGATITVSASVANQGTQAETFDVKAYAGSILVGTKTVTGLAAGASSSLSYSWNTAGVSAGDYPVRVEAAAVSGETDLADNLYNDGTVTLNRVIVHDVAITAASASPLSGLVGTTITITATAANQGTEPETFDVTAYAGTILVGTQSASLPAGGSTDLTFSWDTTGAAAGSYAIKVEASAVAGETDLADNAYTDGTVALGVVVHDVAVTSASASPTSGLVGTLVTISASVANQGTQAETFDVKAYAGSILVGTKTVTALGAGASTSLSYAWDTAAASAGSYVIKVEAAAVAGETDLADNAYTDGTVRLDAIVHDVAVLSASATPLSATVGSPVTISANVANQGNQPETFDVKAYAGPVSVGVQSVSLAAGATRSLTFTWDTSGASPGSYGIQVEAAVVAGETDVADNTFADGTVSLLAVVHDVAVTGVRASPSSALVGDPITIVVTVANEGNQVETFDVTASAEGVAIGTKTVMALAAGASLDVSFTWNTAGAAPGNYTIAAAAASVAGETDLSDNTYTDGVVTLTAVPPTAPFLKLGRIWPEWRRAPAGTMEVFYAKVVNGGSVLGWAQVTYDVYNKDTGAKVASVHSRVVAVPAGTTVDGAEFASEPWSGAAGIYTIVGTLTYGPDPTSLSIVDGEKAISRIAIL